MSPFASSIVMQPTPQPVSSSTFAGCPCPLPDIVMVRILPVVARYSVVFCPSRNSTPVIGSSDSNTVLCFAPRSCIRSPRTTVTAPLPNPIASCERLSSTAKADIWRSQPHSSDDNLFNDDLFKAYRKLFPSIVDVERRKALGTSSLFLRLIKCPHLQYWLVRQILRYCDQKGRTLNLLYLCDLAGIVRFETP